MKKKNYSHSKIERLKRLIPALLKRKNIIERDIECMSSSYLEIYPKIYDDIFTYKTSINNLMPEMERKSDCAIEKATEHDATVISYVLSYKKRSARNIEEVKAVFVTSSYGIFKFYKTKYEQYEQYPSVIMDNTLTNILYLKNPDINKGLQFYQVLKAHCNNLLINNYVWTTYIKLLREMLNDNTISTEEYSMLVSQNQFIQEFLRDKSVADINQKQVSDILNSLKEEDQKKVIKIDELEKVNLEKSQYINNSNEELNKMRAQVNSLENELKKQRYDTAMEKFLIHQNEFSRNQFKIHLKKIRRGLIKYIVFLTIAILLFIFKDIILSFIANQSLKTIIAIIISILIYIAPFFRSFIKHEKILIAFSTLFSKNKNNYYHTIKNEFEHKFKQSNPEPVLEDLIN